MWLENILRCNNNNNNNKTQFEKKYFYQNVFISKGLSINNVTILGVGGGQSLCDSNIDVTLGVGGVKKIS